MISESPANTLIKDPIYGYVELTDLERRVIETSIFQRLRFITQNGLAFYTYPALRGSRFEHSIGACHLAGRVMTALMENSESNTLREFLLDCHQDLGNIIAQEIHDELPKPSANNTEGEPTKPNAWGEFTIQLVRLFALLHDLGHLPFSHLGEEAVEEFVEELLDKTDFAQYENLGCKLHEYIGFKLISDIDGELTRAFEGSTNKIYLDVMRGVYLKKHELKNTKAFRLLYELIDSDIDVDRGDYLRRDGYNSGIGFGRYDIDRLIQSIRVDRLKTDTRMRYIIAPSDSSISPVEDFLLERFKLYKWLYFHHSIRFFNACLIRALKSIIELRDALRGVYPEKFRLEYFHYSRYVYKDGFVCNEIWLWDVFYKSLIELKGIRTPSPEVKQAIVYLEVIVNRAKRGFSVWKTEPEYLEFNQKLKEHLCRSRPSESAGTQYYRLRDKDLKPMAEARVLKEILKEISNETDSRKEFVQRFCQTGVPIYWDDIKHFYGEDLKGRGPLGYAFLNLNKFEPFKESSVSTPDNIVSQFEFLLRRPQDGAKVIRLTDVSRLIKSLYEVWQADIQSNLYFVISSPEYSSLTAKGSALRGKLSEVIRSKVCEQMAKWLEEHKIVTVTS